MPLKKDLPVDIYGGYNEVYASYFALVEHKKGRKRIRTINWVPIHINSKDLSEEDLINYYTTEGLEEPTIIIKMIRMNCLMEINGFKAHISGRQGDSRVEYHCAEQAILSDADYGYCKKIFDHTSQFQTTKKVRPASDYNISPERNLALYDSLTEKYNCPKYAIFFGKISQKLVEGRNLFCNLSNDEQSKLLNEILHLSQCKATRANLKAIGGSEGMGRIVMSNNLSNYESIKIINQSPSGLFENEVDLKKI